MRNTPSYLGVGLYTFPDAGRIIRQPAVKLRRWAVGYQYASRGTSRRSEALFGHDYPDLLDQGIMTFLDLIQLHLIAAFRSHGVKMNTIRQIAFRVADRYSTNHPFAIHRFFTDGQTIIAELERDEKAENDQGPLYEDLLRGQMILKNIAQPFFHNVDYANNLAQIYWPMGRRKGIALDPARAFGQPILVKYGVPTYPLYRMFLAGDTPADIAKWYEVDERAVLNAIEYEKLLAQQRVA